MSYLTSGFPGQFTMNEKPTVTNDNDQFEWKMLYDNLSKWMTKDNNLVENVNSFLRGKQTPLAQKMRAWAKRVSKSTETTTWYSNLEPGTSLPNWGGKRRAKKTRRASKKRKQTRRRRQRV